MAKRKAKPAAPTNLPPVQKRKVGRPSAFVGGPGLVLMDNIVTYLGHGMSRGDAADLCGISRDSIRDEMERNPQFSVRVVMAEAAAKHHYVEAIHKATDEDWKAAAWMLERKWGKEFGNRAEGDEDSERKITVRRIVRPAHNRSTEDDTDTPASSAPASGNGNGRHEEIEVEIR